MTASVAGAFARVRTAGFVGRAVRLADIDLPAAGYLIGVGEDEMHAVLDVETRGGGFDPQKRPKILFEPHVFYRNLVGAERDRAVQAGLAYKAWKAGAYGAESEQYPKLLRAMAINETAALKACSWGLGQILGENYVSAGYDSPQHMVVAFVDGGESEHLQAMVRFIKANHLDDELRAHNWAAFARGYNGAQYKANSYDTKLAAAYAKWAKIKDTPWSPPSEETVTGPIPTPPVAVEPLPPPAALSPTAPAAAKPPAPAEPVPAPAPRPTAETGWRAWLSSWTRLFG
ncbi:N-acetylmuramidase family protein [Methylobacterium sp. ID0610]|uniref:N-acetylmuramidase family protein n=1 Tax=Methylobacterium carpenticola TaxID=3344827 RepID=UPI0036C4C51A